MLVVCNERPAALDAGAPVFAASPRGIRLAVPLPAALHRHVHQRLRLSDWNLSITCCYGIDQRPFHRSLGAHNPEPSPETNPWEDSHWFVGRVFGVAPLRNTSLRSLRR